MSTLSRKDTGHLMGCQTLAAHSPCKVRMGARLVQGSRVLATGHNTPRSIHSAGEDHAFSEHAERVVLRRAGSAAKGATLYVARFAPHKEYPSSQPCARCLGAIVLAGVSRVVFTAETGPVEMRLSQLRSCMENLIETTLIMPGGYVQNVYPVLL